MSVRNVLRTFATGVALGAALGVLFAPEKGSVTRKKIRRAGNGYANGLDQKFDDFIDNVKEQFESVKEEADRMIAEAKNQLESAETDVKKTARKVSNHA